MEYKHEISTTYLSAEDYQESVNDVIVLFKQHNLQTIELLFGYAWGNEYKNWAPFRVEIDSIINEIKIAENFGVGEFGRDDIYFTLSIFNTEILFCHESDIHLRYNDQNALVKDIRKIWEVKDFLRLNQE